MPLSKKRLDALYEKYNDKSYLVFDPLHTLNIHELGERDFEVASFIAAGLSYGRVETIKKSIQDLWKKLGRFGVESNGSGLHHFLLHQYDPKLVSRALIGWKHRLNTHQDLGQLFAILHEILKKYKSLARLYQCAFHPEAKIQVDQFCAEALSFENLCKGAKKGWTGTGAKWFFCRPQKSSSCKRLMMWMRWMVRHDNIDPGLWRKDSILIDARKKIPCPSRLYIPLDTHIFQWAKKNQILLRSSQNWQSVEDITNALREIEPKDPVKYDFALCHQNMLRDFS